MDRLLSDDRLRILTEKYCFLDGSEIPFLIKALHSARNLQLDLRSIENEKVKPLLEDVEKLDNAIAVEILSNLGQIQGKVNS
ncbi:MAG: hypothetical protein RMY28_009720 [Nostoc sp. ChiSLP01]|nr:hypothetical protein [Nostoc sp. CmiSLP01]MDZ8285168.1 hypothetical protein [Nostoc sp. ChiSLP01]